MIFIAERKPIEFPSNFIRIGIAERTAPPPPQAVFVYIAHGMTISRGMTSELNGDYSSLNALQGKLAMGVYFNPRGLKALP